MILSAGFCVAAIGTGDPHLYKCAVGSLTGIMISPDLDVDAGNVSNKIIRKKIGRFAEKIWNGIWHGYKKSFKHGRFASHFPIYGTLTRVFYLYFWFVMLPHLAIWLLIPVSWSLIYVLTWYAKMFFEIHYLYGLMSADLIHQALDVMTKESKK